MVHVWGKAQEGSKSLAVSFPVTGELLKVDKPEGEIVWLGI